MSSNRKLVAVGALALALIGGAVFWLLRPVPPPVKLSLVRIRAEGTNGAEAIIHFTNYTADRFSWTLRTSVLSNGVWTRAPSQPVIDYAAATLPAHGSGNHAVPVPPGQTKWKIELRCRRRDTRLEDAVENAFRFAKLGNPLPDSRRKEIITVLEFER